MAFTPLGDTLSDKFGKNQTLKKQVEASEAVEVADVVMKEMFGEELSKDAKPLFVKNRTITISCASSAIAQEIRLNQHDIVAKINEKLGKSEVDRIRYLA